MFHPQRKWTFLIPKHKIYDVISLETYPFIRYINITFTVGFMRYSKSFIHTILQEYVNGSSLNQLVKNHHLPKTTMYYWFVKRGVIRRISRIKKLENNDEFLVGAFIGFWAGDGSRSLDKNSAYVVRFHLNPKDKETIFFVQSFLLQLFGKKGGSLPNNTGLDIKIISKFIFFFIDRYLKFEQKAKTYTIRLKDTVRSHTPKFLYGFVCGLALSDGCFGKNFIFSTTSTLLANQFIKALVILGFSPKKYLQRRRETKHKSIWRVWLTSSESRKFKELVYAKLPNTAPHF